MPPEAKLILTILAFQLFVGIFGPPRVAPVLHDKSWRRPTDLSRNPELNFGLPGYEKDCTVTSATRAVCYMVPCSYAEMCMIGTKHPHFKSPGLDVLETFDSWAVTKIASSKKTCADMGYVAAFEDLMYPRGVAYAYIPEESYYPWTHSSFGGLGGVVFYAFPMLIRGMLRHMLFGGRLSELINHCWVSRFFLDSLLSTSTPLSARWWWLTAPYQGGAAPPLECTYGDPHGSWTYVTFFTAYIQEGGRITNPYGMGYLNDHYNDTRARGPLPFA